MRNALFALLLTTASCTNVDQDRWRMFNDEGVTLFAKGAYREALENFDYALSLHTEDAVIYYNMAQCHDAWSRRPRTVYACLQRDRSMATPAHLDHHEISLGPVWDANQMIRDWLTQDPKSADPLVADAWRLARAKLPARSRPVTRSVIARNRQSPR